MKYNKILFAGLLLIFFSACTDSFLEEQPKSLLSPSNFPASADDCELVLGGIGNILYGGNFYQRPLYLLAEVGSDETILRYSSGDRYELDYMEYTTNNQYIRKPWQACYQIINQANVLIKYLPDEEWAKQYVGAAKFYRAWMYFYIVRLWGPTILVTEPTEQLNENDVVVRVPELDVFNLIVEDLKYAEENLPLSWTKKTSSPDDGRPSKGAAKILLAKTYLTMAGWPIKDASKWALASAKANEVINLGIYQLEPNFSDLFLIAKKNGKEHILSIQNTEPGGTMMGVQSRPNGKGIKKGGWYLWATSVAFMNTFSDDDDRKDGSFLTELVQPGHPTIPFANFRYNKKNDVPGPAIQKWQDFGRDKITDNGKRTAMNIPIFRYAEALLIRAEAENEVNGPNAAAYEAFNAVRGRSNSQNLLPTGLSKSDFRTAVRQEWSFELAFELKRRFNLLRWELFDSVMSKDHHAKKGFAPYKKYYPIPQAEFDAGMDPNLQTEGYR